MYVLLTVVLPLLCWFCLTGLLCLLLCSARLATAPRRLGLAAVAYAGHLLAPLLGSERLWASVFNFESLFRPASAFTQPVYWGGKVAGLLWSLLLLYGLRWVSPQEAGLQAPRPGTLRGVLLVVVGVAVIVLLNAYLARHAFLPRPLPRQLVVATLPGLEEELFYRGVLLGLLSRVFPRTISLPWSRTSWGGLVGVLLFTLGHGLKFPAFLGSFFYEWGYGSGGAARLLGYEVQAWLLSFPLSLGELLFLLAMGTLFLWVRERTGSCWAAVGAHCLLNSALVVGHALG